MSKLADARPPHRPEGSDTFPSREPKHESRPRTITRIKIKIWGALPAEQRLDDDLVNGIGMKLKLIKTGAFKMGSPDSDKDEEADEKPQHRRQKITRPFYLGIYPVTKAQFAAFVSDADYKTEAEQAGDKATWRDPGFVQTDDEPVVFVSWNDAGEEKPLRVAKPEGEEDLPAAHGGPVGVRLPGGHDRGLFLRRRPQDARGLRLVWREFGGLTRTR